MTSPFPNKIVYSKESTFGPEPLNKTIRADGGQFVPTPLANYYWDLLNDQRSVIWLLKYGSPTVHHILTLEEQLDREERRKANEYMQSILKCPEGHFLEVGEFEGDKWADCLDENHDWSADDF